MKPLFGSQNNQGQWWDGEQWRKWGEHDSVRIFEIIRQHDEKNCHVDGCFKCPRCWMMHFVPCNYDLLCDGCSDLLMTNKDVSEELKQNILLWRSKARNHYAGKADSDIVERIALRERLTNT